ncbi:hypothetical protein CANARDRAFT_201552 [[Candida] arabinofermentans NRRL YB-2248]|uniref:Zn(2)-C6 fungal-type domain-containing protein n=1 Tax=[Candida] arabinofermentans NRRL YB-2248 TaxID=983967 RepID=A0A1E4SXN8_9ASCO|nr:hypothetical protein CANARDRAFT_201552 [[Candida] arabinofermentans NRRL YB-2248]
MASAETEDQPRKKRKYSRNGCKECKRRKLKCDEGKPKCWNCSHLNKDCTYEKNIKFKNSRSFTIQNNVTDIHNFSKTSPTSSASSKPGEDVFIQQAPMIVQNPSTPLFSGVTPGPQTGGILTMPTIQEQSMTEGRPRKHIPVESPSTMVRTRQQSIELDNNLFTGASNLILDLNDLIHNFGADFPSPFAQNSRNLSLGNRPNNDAPPNNDFEQVQSAFPPPPPFIMMEESKERFEYLYSMNKSISQADLINLAQFFQWSVSSSHISYLKIFITKVHMNALPFTTSFLHSSFIRCFLLQAKSSAHLLFALLAIAARYESYQVNRLPEKDESVRKKLKFHNRMRSYYLSSCLKSLDAILHSKPKILNNIESLLLTILILASDYSGSTGSQWRAHLRGAKDLLIKYCTFKPTSLELAIIWIWFYSMETLAGLTVPSGGTIHEFDELIEFLDYVKSTGRIGNTLNRFGFLQAGSYDNELFSRDGIPEDDNDPRSTRYHTSFNLYLGYNDDIIDTFKEIVLALEASRWFSNKEKASPGSTFKNPSATQSPDDLPLINEILNDQGQVRNTHILKITMMIERSRSFKIINNKPPYRIPIDSLYHPLNLRGYHYNNPTGANIVMSNYIHNTNPQTCSLNDFENWYSWADLSQQLYADAALLKLLTMKHCYGKNGLSIQNGLVQDVVDRMILGLVSLIQLKNNISSSDLKELDAYYNETNVSTPTDAVSVTTELIAENIKLIIDCCFNALMNLGVGSGEISLMKLKNLWTLEKSPDFDYANYDIFGDSNDSVPFT